jgi:hypothetical protein
MTQRTIDKTKLIVKMNETRHDLKGAGSLLGKFYIVVGDGIRFLKGLADVESVFRETGPTRWGRYV